MKTSFNKIICPFCEKEYEPKEYIPKTAGDYDRFYIKCENKECKEEFEVLVYLDIDNLHPENISLYEQFNYNNVCIQTNRDDEDLFEDDDSDKNNQSLFDERLTVEENEELMGEDVFDIHEIFENTEEALKELASKLPNKSIKEISNDIKNEAFVYSDAKNDLKYKSCQYFVFKSGRIAIVEFY